MEEDVHSVADFIRLYATRFNRWDSPKFLAGESYGTTRAAALVGYLQEQLGMNFNGIILVSSVLNFQTLRFDEGNDLPYILYLPSYTATAWYHKKLPSDLQADRRRALAEAEKFALSEYTLALMKGSALSADEHKQIAQKLARYTGLSEDFVQRSHLRIDISRFTKELLRDQRQTVGRYDSRFKGEDRDAVGDRSDYDPSYAAVQGAYTALWNQYVRSELKYDSDLPYHVLTDQVQPWDFGSAKNRYLNVAPTLREAMTQNHDLRVFVANGYYDLADALPGHAVHLQPPEPKRRPVGAHHAGILQRRPHDVHQPAVAAEAQERFDRVPARQLAQGAGEGHRRRLTVCEQGVRNREKIS